MGLLVASLFSLGSNKGDIDVENNKQARSAPVNTGGHQPISLALLTFSPLNVRKTSRDEGIVALAASIEAHGLRQNLNVRNSGDGTYEVVAGGRRLAALQLLAKDGKIPADYPVPCLLLNTLEDAEEISLAENELRVAMHPADQFTAFKALADKGMSNEDIAARFGITPAVVTRRLKLAAVSPAIIESYRHGQLDLEKVMAFTLCANHDQQEKVWRELAEDDNLFAWRIKRELTTGMAEVGRDKMAKFVGADAYEAAGGTLERDLFSERQDAFMVDSVLLKRLYDEKVEELVSSVEAEGFAWVEYWEDMDYTRNFDGIRPEVEHEDEDEDDDSDIEPADDELTPEEKAASGAIVRIVYGGEVVVRRGLVERKRGQEKDEEKPSGPPPEFSAPMTTTLTGHRTAAIRKSLIEQPTIALRALAHCLAGKLLMDGYSWQFNSCLSIDPRHHVLDTPNPEECRAHAEMDEVIASWKTRLPKERTELWGWLMEQDDQTVLDIIVAATSLTAFAVSERAEKAGGDYLTEALSLNMASWWAPSLDGFINRMKKSELARAVREAGQPEEASRIEGMKKADATAAAARALDGTRWLPQTLKSKQEA